MGLLLRVSSIVGCAIVWRRAIIGGRVSIVGLPVWRLVVVCFIDYYDLFLYCFCITIRVVVTLIIDTVTFFSSLFSAINKHNNTNNKGKYPTNHCSSNTACNWIWRIWWWCIIWVIIVAGIVFIISIFGIILRTVPIIVATVCAIIPKAIIAHQPISKSNYILLSIYPTAYICR